MATELKKRRCESNPTNGKRRRFSLETIVETAGKIKKIKLQNFMCHSNLEFEFNHRINFISGKNGSGKSAIMTAIVLGLGGRTADTNRGHSLKNLIKSGEIRCVIEITLNNLGTKSYNRELFGNYFKIVRSITETSSTYKLVPEYGKAIPLKKNELLCILMSFNIQVTNPVCMLNQDVARTFLKTATPKDLFQLFYRGTLLLDVEDTYLELSNRRIPQLRAIVEKRKKIVEEDCKDLFEYQNKCKSFMEFASHLEEQQKIQNILYWLDVTELSEKISKTQQNSAEIKKTIEIFEEKIDKGLTKQQDLVCDQNTLEQEIALLKEQKNLEENKGLEFEQKLLYHQSLVKKKFTDINNLKKRIANEDLHCKEIQEVIDTHNRRCEELQAKRAFIEKQKLELTNRSEQLKAAQITADVHKQQLFDTLNAFQKKIDVCQSNYRSCGVKLEYKKNYLTNLKAKSGDGLSIYTKWMAQLVGMVKAAYNNKKFREMPRGPVASFIKLKEKSWGPAVESIISPKILLAFCVDNSNDFQVFKNLVSKLNLPPKEKPTIFITKFFYKVHDVRRTETVHPKYSNLLQALEVSDPIISNLIIDQLKADTILLIPTNAEAYPLMDNINNVPLNCKRAITIEGDLFYPQPNYRSYAGNVSNSTRFLQISAEQAIRFAQDEVANLQLLHEKHYKEYKELMKEHVQIAKVRDEAVKEADKISRQLLACEDKLLKLGEEELPENYDVNVFHDDLKCRKDLKAKYEEEMAQVLTAKMAVEDVLKTMENEKQEMKSKKEEFFRKMKEKEKELQSIKEKLKKFDFGNDKSQHLLKTYQSRYEMFMSNLKELEQDHVNALSIAKQACPEPINTESSREELEESLRKVTSTIKNLEKRLGPKPVEPHDHQNRMERFNNAIVELKNMKIFPKTLEEHMQIIEARLKSIKRYVSAATKQSFKSIVEMRKFVGDLKIDYENKTLAINIQSDPHSNKDSVISTLSGGERSFSMVALIMTLWNNMSTPFYFLDEFDVFMDDVNRKLIMDLLIGHATNRPSKQYVFLTPHGANSKESSIISSFSMGDPRPS